LLVLWQALNEEEGENEIVEWVGRLLYENDEVNYFDNYPNVAFIRMETVKVLHEVFHVKFMNGMDI
jgi:hypothetical protein